MKKQVLLDDKEFCHFTGYNIAYFDKKGLIAKDRGLIDLEESLSLILKSLDTDKKLSRKRVLNLIARVDEYRTPIAPSINKTQFGHLIGIKYRDDVDDVLKKYEDAPKSTQVKKEKMYDLKEVNKFIEENNIFTFSNYLAQQFIQRPRPQKLGVKNGKNIDRFSTRSI